MTPKVCWQLWKSSQSKFPAFIFHMVVVPIYYFAFSIEHVLSSMSILLFCFEEESIAILIIMRNNYSQKLYDVARETKSHFSFIVSQCFLFFFLNSSHLFVLHYKTNKNSFKLNLCFFFLWNDFVEQITVQIFVTLSVCWSNYSCFSYYINLFINIF